MSDALKNPEQTGDKSDPRILVVVCTTCRPTSLSWDYMCAARVTNKT